MARDPNYYTIQRCPHDGENPFAQINRQLIRDENISPECRWLLIYMLSMKDGWQMKVPQIHEHVKKYIGINKIYKLIDEGIEAGYIRREYILQGNLRKGCIYYISESPKFKKCFRHDDFRDLGARDHENHEALRENIVKDKQKEEDITSEVQAPSDPTPSPISEEATKVSLELFDRVKKLHPKAKEPNFANWEKTLDLIHRRDNRSWEEIRAMIAWAYEDAFWYKQIQSPEALRRHWDKMAIQASPVSNKSILSRKNREIAQSVKQHLKKSGREGHLWIGGDLVVNNANGESIDLDLPTETFEPILCKWFSLKKE